MNEAIVDWTIAGVILAAVGVLLTLMGNPKIFDFERRKATASNAVRPDSRNDTSRRKIIDVTIEQLSAAAANYVEFTPKEYDLVVGIKPGGTYLAQTISTKLGVGLIHLEKTYVNSDLRPFSIFQGVTHARSTNRASVFLLSEINLKIIPERILVVDAVATFGNSFRRAEEIICLKYSNCKVNFFVYAVDEARLSASGPDIYRRTFGATKIDNFMVWLRFPWESHES